MDWRYLVLILAVILIPFIMMGKNPFEPPEGYVPPDEFKDGIRAKIEQPAGFGTIGGFSVGTTGNGVSGGSGFNGALPMPTPSQNGMPIVPYESSPLAANPGTNQLPAPANAGLNAPSQNGVAPAPSSASPFAPQPLQTQPQPFQQPTPFQSLPVPGSKLEFIPGQPVFKDQQGKIVAFFGVQVFTADKRGMAQFMPDGTYTLSNGHTIEVRNGKKWWPNDANKLN